MYASLGSAPYNIGVFRCLRDPCSRYQCRLLANRWLAIGKMSTSGESESHLRQRSQQQPNLEQDAAPKLSRDKKHNKAAPEQNKWVSAPNLSSLQRKCCNNFPLPGSVGCSSVSWRDWLLLRCSGSAPIRLPILQYKNRLTIDRIVLHDWVHLTVRHTNRRENNGINSSSCMCIITGWVVVGSYTTQLTLMPLQDVIKCDFISVENGLTFLSSKFEVDFHLIPLKCKFQSPNF